ncbi:hypothetical protein [Sphingomonas glacialis]|uniref:Uncharacterized protein n=1 Tax=Sphingomonas glacialis TaxID=658225 RepID=A0A502FT11_9SPHN|nr:hypothetical protein [Sphingomonas glacialis]TPG52256.1 hypothetical protein EAH76_15295 [Sphingomonas glacialis]
MTERDDVEKLIVRLSPEPVCDDCIGRTLRLADAAHTHQRIRELAGSNGFERLRQVCSLCGMERISIHRVSR